MKTATFDIETNGLFPEVDTVWCAVVKEHETDVTKIFTPANIHDLCDHLNTFDCLITHNGIAYDFPVLRKVFGWEYKGEKRDTLLMSRLQRPNRRTPPPCPVKQPHSVAAWGYRVGHLKIEHEDWDQFSPEMLHRCKEDVEIQVKIYQQLLQEGAREGWDKAHYLNHKLFAILQRQEEYGWCVDGPHMDRCLHTLDRWISRIDRVIDPYLPVFLEVEETKKDGEYNYIRRPIRKDGTIATAAERWAEATGQDPDTVGGPFMRIHWVKTSLDSNKQVKRFLLQQGWVPDEWNTNNVGEKTSPKLSKDDSFQGIKGGLGRLVAKRTQCRQRRGIITGWLDQIRPDGRIGAGVSGLATTGRTRHRVIVNVPKEGTFFGRQMRECFIAQPGWLLVGVDSKGNQIRQLAARMSDDVWTKAVLFGTEAEGTDLHSINQKRTGVKTRTEAKNFIYGIIFGAGNPKIGKIIGGSADEGKRLREQVFREIPLLKLLIDTLTDRWRKSAKTWFNKTYNRLEHRDGWIRGLDGRLIRVDSEHKVLVYTLQSDEAIHMSTAYCILHKKLTDMNLIWGKDYGIVGFFHDEWQIECRLEVAHEIGRLSCDAIKEAGKWYKIVCPHEGKYKIGMNWHETH